MKEYYPKKEAVIAVTQTYVEVKLQAMLDYTSLRIVQTKKNVLMSQGLERMGKLSLVSKWGFDGLNQSEYKKRVVTNPEETDEIIFISSLVTLLLTVEKSRTNEEIVIWQNRRRSSKKFVRSIRFEFAHELPVLSNTERFHVEYKIMNLHQQNELSMAQSLR